MGIRSRYSDLTGRSGHLGVEWSHYPDFWALPPHRSWAVPPLRHFPSALATLTIWSVSPLQGFLVHLLDLTLTDAVLSTLPCPRTVQLGFRSARDGAMAVAERPRQGVFPLSLILNVNVGVFYPHWPGPSSPTRLCVAHVLDTSSMLTEGYVRSLWLALTCHLIYSPLRGSMGGGHILWRIHCRARRQREYPFPRGTVRPMNVA